MPWIGIIAAVCGLKKFRKIALAIFFLLGALRGEPPAERGSGKVGGFGARGRLPSIVADKKPWCKVLF
jgi:hypothetical protein